MEQLSGLDNVLVSSESPTIPLHISGLFIYNPATAPQQVFGFNAFRQHLSTLLQDQPALRSKLQDAPLGVDRPYWCSDQHFNIDFHLHHIALPEPADWNQLHELCGRFHAEPLARNKPLWEAWYIEGLDHLDGVPKGGVGLFVKVHHGMMDGISALQLFDAFHTVAPITLAEVGQNATPSAHRVVRYPQEASLSRGQMLFRAARHQMTRPFKLARAVANIFTQERSSGSGDYTEAAVPRTPFNQRVSDRRCLGHVRFDLAALRQVASANGATLNDVALAIVGGALRNYLQESAQLPLRSLVAAMPMNVRHGKTEQHNVFSLALIPLATDAASPRERIAKIREFTANRKAQVRQSGGWNLKALIDNLYVGPFVALGKWALANDWLHRIPVTANTVVSNVPGATGKRYLLGAELVDYLGFGPIAPTMSLYQLVTSTDNHLSISFTACPDVLPEAEAYASALKNSFAELQESAQLSVVHSEKQTEQPYPAGSESKASGAETRKRTRRKSNAAKKPQTESA